ncbi:MAG: hypothetical protein QW838_05950 [Candidatus Nitrosotenuis sp.]
MNWTWKALILLNHLSARHCYATRSPVAGACNPQGQQWRRNTLAPLLLALGIFLQLAAGYSLVYLWQAAAWAALLYGCLLARRAAGPRWVLVALVLILASFGSAALASWWRHDGLWAFNLHIALWMAPMLAYYIAAAYNAERTLDWLIVGGWVMAGAVLYDGLTHAGLRASGFTDSPNPAAQFLVVTAAWALAKGIRARSPHPVWAAVPMVAVLPLTGSRWPMATLALVIVGLLVTRRDAWQSWGRTAPVMVALLTATLVSCAYAPLQDRLAADIMLSDTARRMTMERTVSLWPTGIVGTGEGSVHNVPLRMAMELGLPATLAWAGVTGYALWRRPRYDGAWWALATVVVLEMMDYSLYVGPLAPLWWLLVGARVRQQGQRAHA